MRAITRLAAACLVCVSGATADSIVLDGKTHNDVYIAESATRYYVQNPIDGSVFSVDKSKIDASNVTITQDAAQRKAWLNQWKEKQGLTQPAEPSPAPVEAVDQAPKPQTSFEEIRMRKELRDLAEFEGDFEYWTIMSPFAKGDVAQTIQAKQQQVNQSATQSLAAIGEQASVVESEKAAIREGQAQEAERIAGLYDAERQDIEYIYDNPALKHYNRMYDRALLWRHYDDYWHIDDPYYYDYDDWRVHYYGYKANEEFYRTQQAANETSQAYQLERDAARANIGALEAEAREKEKELKKLALEQKRVATFQHQVENTSARIASRLMALDAAADEGFRPQLPKKLVRQWQRTGPSKTERFEITSNFWRVDWATFGTGSIKGRIYAAEDDRLVAVFPKQTILNFPFMILEGKGRYYVEIETSTHCEHYVAVCEVGSLP
ncbi:MAG: hypothetical protein AMXMBFR84_02030 [Candidatus Hydrogenedentota bacterium]